MANEKKDKDAWGPEMHIAPDVNLLVVCPEIILELRLLNNMPFFVFPCWF